MPGMLNSFQHIFIEKMDISYLLFLQDFRMGINDALTPFLDDGYKDIGSLLGFCVGRFIEKTWVKFKETGLNLKGIAMGIIGLLILVLMMKFLKGSFLSLAGARWGGFAFHAFLIIYVVALFHMAIRAVCGNGK